MGSGTFDDCTQPNDCVIVPTQSQLARYQRQIECTGRTYDVNLFIGSTVTPQGVDRPVHQLLHDEAIETGSENCETQLAHLQITFDDFDGIHVRHSWG
jgi:hypothetical protein